MISLSQEQIKEIAQELECGMTCYYNQKNKELLFIPNPKNHPDMELKYWKDSINKVRKNKSSFIVIEPPESYESFNIMAEFVESLPESLKLKTSLIRALSNRKPFRQFNFEIDNAGNYREKWFEFRTNKHIERVIEILENNTLS